MAQKAKTITLEVTVPADYTIHIFGAGITIPIPWLKLSAIGLAKVLLYGLGRYLRDGAQSTYATDKNGKCIETEAGKKQKCKAHAEARLEALISGEVSTVQRQRVPTVIRYLQKNVVLYATRGLGMKHKDVPSLGATVESIKRVADTLEGCPFDRLLKTAQAQAELEDGIDFTVDPNAA